YWDARVRWANELSRNDPALFRALVPCDPVVTVAPDVVFFECFAKDESAYGCLTVERGAFGESGPSNGGLGTTNVDYSLALYDHFQTLRTYRATRLLVDPTGFEVATEKRASYREEKIDLPPSWLRGFGQLQAAMALPSSRVELSVDVVYSVLAFLKRHREKAGPRSLRLSLLPGIRPKVTIEPSGIELVSRGAPYQGSVHGEVRLWGRRRLMSLARLLPLAEKVEVLVFGSGLPSIWTVHMREMRFVLGLSGWTANDWTRGSNLDTFFAGFEAPPGAVDALGRYLEVARHAKLGELEQQIALPRKQTLAALHHLAKRGQLVYDYAASLYRWRPLMPVALSETLLGGDSPELDAARKAVANTDVKITREEPLEGGRRIYAGVVGNVQCEGILDLDGAFKNAKCSCSFFYKNRLRQGPCRHLLALRMTALPSVIAAAPLPPVASHVSTGMVTHLPEATVAAIQREAERRSTTVHVVVEQAWRIARSKIQAAASLDALLGTMRDSAYRGSGQKVPQLVSLPADVEAEIQREAARLDVTVSRIVEAGWVLAVDVMRLTSSLLH
ncbi:MAG TPA: SWIM zinc finger family protein, partial [Labilithrix sp.]|nr:SWIM zinc finger family protein [Labilithrix sp.]